MSRAITKDTIFCPLVLFVGAHPDDIELGATGLITRLISNGFSIHFLILTDNAHDYSKRQIEAKDAAKILGIEPDKLHFAGLRDGELKADAKAVSRIRDLMNERNIDPDIIITHTEADSHNDHIQANCLMRAAFREKILLTFSVHTSAETSRFNPRLFISLTEEMHSIKKKVLAKHCSQILRLNKGNRLSYETYLGSLCGLPAAEAFEITTQVLNDPQKNLLYNQLLEISDAPFHALWVRLINNGPLYLLYEAFLPQPPSIASYSRDHECVGRDFLRDAFNNQWLPRTPLIERTSNNQSALKLCHTENVLLAGGPVNNPITRDYFNQLSSVDWIIEYDSQNTEPVFLRQKSTNRQIKSERDASGLLKKDLAVLTIMRNPDAEGKIIVNCAGVHGAGTAGLLRFLANPSTNPQLFNRIIKEDFVNITVKVNIHDYSLELL